FAGRHVDDRGRTRGGRGGRRGPRRARGRRRRDRAARRAVRARARSAARGRAAQSRALARTEIIPPVLHSGSVRRRQGGVLVAGAAEPQVQPWLRAAGYPTRAVPDVAAALAALDDGPPDLVVVDR